MRRMILAAIVAYIAYQNDQTNFMSKAVVV